MRGLFSYFTAKETAEPASPPGGQTERPFRSPLAINSALVLGASLLGAPVAILMLIEGALLPFALVVIGLSTGCLSLALHRRGQDERAAAGQVFGTLATGLILTLADPAIADFGMAIALLAPIQAFLAAPGPAHRHIWLALGAVAALGGASATGWLPWPEGFRAEFGIAAGLAFAVVAAGVTYAASQIRSTSDAGDMAQISTYRHLVEHAQDAVLRFSGQGSMLFASKSAEKLLGCHRYELAGTGLIDRIHVLDRPIYMTAFSQSNQDGVARTLEIRMRRDEPSGPSQAPHFIWVEVSFSPVIDARKSGAAYELVALLRDITRRRDQEIEMREARRLAEDASSAKSRFLATIGHELRTPLNAIVGFSEMMTSGVVGELSPAHREYAALIHQSGHHLLDVVKMLLDMSRIEAGKFEVQAEAFQPDVLVGPCLEMVAGMARGKQVSIVADMPRVLPALVADERACRQILINLLSNAIKFSHDKGVVTLSMKRQGRQLNISVTDRGIGMDASVVGRIGEPFFQAEDGLSRHYEGTGLGLSIVKGLVDLHHGSLHAASVPGEGTTMTVLLPLNGPATKLEHDATVMPLHRDAAPPTMPEWQDQQRKAL